MPYEQILRRAFEIVRNNLYLIGLGRPVQHSEIYKGRPEVVTDFDSRNGDLTNAWILGFLANNLRQLMF